MTTTTIDLYCGSKDKKFVFKMNIECAKLSGAISQMLESIDEDDEQNLMFCVPSAQDYPEKGLVYEKQDSEETIDLINKWCENQVKNPSHYITCGDEEESNDKKRLRRKALLMEGKFESEFDTNLLKDLVNKQLISLITVTGFLDITELHDKACMHMADTRMKGKTPEEIRALLPELVETEN